VVGAATAKLREPKHVRTRGTANKLQSDERSLRDGAYSGCLGLQVRHLYTAAYREAAYAVLASTSTRGV